MRRLVPEALALLAALALARHAEAIPRGRVVACAYAYAYHPWTATAANMTASCASGYRSPLAVGDHLGVAYDWGGYVSLHTFDEEIAAAYGAGSPAGGDVHDCTTGVDCSGFVSRCWEVGHNTTSSIPDIASVVAATALEPGDVFNQAGYHVTMFVRSLADGTPLLVEAFPPAVFVNFIGGWDWVDGFTPMRLDGIEAGGVGAAGTAADPIQVETFPFVHSGTTTGATSDVLDHCAASSYASDRREERGPEVIYALDLASPGRVTASVEDDGDADVDVHVYTALAEGDCVARDDRSVVADVDCGRVYVVVDTYTNAEGVEMDGAYTLTVTFAPSTSPCGAGAFPYDLLGGPGDPCGSSAPCEPSLVCLTSGTSSACAALCEEDLDCDPIYPDGCCRHAGDIRDLPPTVGWCEPAAACMGGDGDVDADVDSDVDSDVDGDVDGDVDTDVDSDVDGDIDADTDVDTDVDGDVDTDVDGDVDGDGDADGEGDDGGEPGCGCAAAGARTSTGAIRALLAAVLALE